MPEMTFTIRWPDGTVDPCYSPSLVMHDHLEVGDSYGMAEFIDRTSSALELASERVRAKFGFACTSAAATIDHIRSTAIGFGPDDLVEVLDMQPSLASATGGPS
jgi:uncharacterized repeat protein (TIGR04042 family)